MKGLTIKPREIAALSPVIDLMAALKRSLAQEAIGSKRTASASQKTKKKIPDRGQAALLLPLAGGRKRKAKAAGEPATLPARRHKQA